MDQLTPSEFDRLKWEREIEIRPAERAHDAHKETIQATDQAAIQTGQLTLRTAVLINGGAAAAILAFIGGLVSQGRVPVEQTSDVARGISWFAYGVAAAVTGMGLGYLTNLAM